MFSYEYLDILRKAEIGRVIPLLPPGARVLEIGAGTGTQALELRRHGFQVTAIEMSTSNYADHRIFPVVDYDGATIPVPDASIDVAYSSNVLEHVPDLARLYSEIRRVLAPGGICVHVVPTHAWRFWTTVTTPLDGLLYLVTDPAAVTSRNQLDRQHRLAHPLYGIARRVAGRCLPHRHGERGNVISETWLFHPRWWRRNFAENGFTVLHEEPIGLFYTGNLLFGARLTLAQRRRLSPLLGSACRLFKLAPMSKYYGDMSQRDRGTTPNI